MKNPLPVHELARGNGSAFANGFVVGIGICISPRKPVRKPEKTHQENEKLTEGKPHRQNRNWPSQNLGGKLENHHLHFLAGKWENAHLDLLCAFTTTYLPCFHGSYQALWHTSPLPRVVIAPPYPKSLTGDSNGQIIFLKRRDKPPTSRYYISERARSPELKNPSVDRYKPAWYRV